MTEGGDLDKLGRGTVWTGEIDGCLHQNHVFALRPVDGRLDARFLAYTTQSAESRRYFESTGVRTTNLASISRSKVLDLLVPLPPIEEQRRIADFLDAETDRVGHVMDVMRTTVDALVERREAAMLASVTGSQHHARRPSDLGWAKTLPSAWFQVRLGLVARMGSGHTPSRSHPEWWVNCSIPWITTGEVQQIRDDRREVIYETREMISEVGLANSAAELHPAGTVVLSRTASAGFSAVMGSDMATSQDFVTWTCGPRLYPYYLLWCLRAMRPDLLGRLATGSTHKTIYFPDLQMLRIPLPDLVEQKDIVANIRRQNAQVDQLIDKVNRQLDLLAERRAALISAAARGEFDVSTAGGRGVAESEPCIGGRITRDGYHV